MKHKDSLLLRPEQLADELGVSTTSLWRWRQKGDFPKPIKLGPRLIGWERSVIDSWLNGKRDSEEGDCNGRV